MPVYNMMWDGWWRSNQYTILKFMEYQEQLGKKKKPIVSVPGTWYEIQPAPYYLF